MASNKPALNPPNPELQDLLTAARKTMDDDYAQGQEAVNTAFRQIKIDHSEPPAAPTRVTESATITTPTNANKPIARPSSNNLVATPTNNGKQINKRQPDVQATVARRPSNNTGKSVTRRPSSNALKRSNHSKQPHRRQSSNSTGKSVARQPSNNTIKSTASKPAHVTYSADNVSDFARSISTISHPLLGPPLKQPTPQKSNPADEKPGRGMYSVLDNVESKDGTDGSTSRSESKPRGDVNAFPVLFDSVPCSMGSDTGDLAQHSTLSRTQEDENEQTVLGSSSLLPGSAPLPGYSSYQRSAPLFDLRPGYNDSIRQSTATFRPPYQTMSSPLDHCDPREPDPEDHNSLAWESWALKLLIKDKMGLNEGDIRTYLKVEFDEALKRKEAKLAYEYGARSTRYPAPYLRARDPGMYSATMARYGYPGY